MENEINFQPVDNKRKIKLWIILGFSSVVTVSLICYAVYFWQKVKTEQLEKKYQQQIINIQTQRTQQLQENLDNGLPNVDNQTEQVARIGLDKILIDWEKKVIEVKEICDEGNQCFLVGKIANDDPAYKGKSFYLEAIPTMGGSDMRHYIIEKTSDGVGKKVYAEGDQGAENGVIIVGISDIPDEITFPGTNYRLKKHYSPNSLFSEVKTKKKIFSDRNLGDFYLTEDGCIVAELPDHTTIAYDFIIPFISDQSSVIDVTLNSGEKNKDEYDYIDASCGGVCTYLSEAEGKLKPDDNIEAIGKTVNGEDIYRLKDPNDKILKDLYNNKNTIAYYSDDYKDQGKSKYSYDEFIKLNPYLFWKDPIGRWIKFTNSKFSSAAEMCKPVIYLYPQDKISMDVKVNINGSLTYTNPLYNDGWKVEVSPGGQIKSLGTGEYFNYLLWEGIGLNYPKQKEGWVIKRENIDSFFDEKLTKLGLNDKEANDFKEYWLSRLNEKSFYRISFLSQKQFGSLASVEFNPITPNVFIRVMMTAEGLDDYINIPEQKLPNTPQRSGFTAVEWGGALLK
jgi:hypothetical protein